jgi:hypothetical protein
MIVDAAINRGGSRMWFSRIAHTTGNVQKNDVVVTSYRYHSFVGKGTRVLLYILDKNQKQQNIRPTWS